MSFLTTNDIWIDTFGYALFNILLWVKYIKCSIFALTNTTTIVLLFNTNFSKSIGCAHESFNCIWLWFLLIFGCCSGGHRSSLNWTLSTCTRSASYCSKSCFSAHSWSKFMCILLCINMTDWSSMQITFLFRSFTIKMINRLSKNRETCCVSYTRIFTICYLLYSLMSRWSFTCVIFF